MASENNELRKVGLKVTLPRVKILQMLESSQQHHLSAEEVHKALSEQGDDVGLATVYRVLTQFESAGLVVRHNFDSGHSVFEIARGEHHDHMVDLDSGKVIEFHNDEIESLQRKIAAEYSYELVDHSLVLYVNLRLVDYGVLLPHSLYQRTPVNLAIRRGYTSRQLTF
ncbi:MAG: ferric iron uptake transcriptional regulator [Cellvibrio sp.]|nr:ferric iron uptake transcriptional regulator [Cellvibrio sp.]